MQNGTEHAKGVGGITAVFQYLRQHRHISDPKQYPPFLAPTHGSGGQSLAHAA